MGDICGDNRFEVIAKAKQHLLDSTNIHTSEDEMKALDSFLFRCWQMGWLKRYDDTATDWKKVKDDGYPRPIEGHAVSEFVLVSWQVALPDLGFPRFATVAQYDYGKMLWLDRDNKIIAGVTHWMPIVLPKGNDMTKKDYKEFVSLVKQMRECQRKIARFVSAIDPITYDEYEASQDVLKLEHEVDENLKKMEV